MKKKNENAFKQARGITLAFLILTIAILLIIVTISLKSGYDSISNTGLEGFFTQLEIIQRRVDEIASTDENYVASDGTRVYLKQQGANLTSEQSSSLTSILATEGISAPAEKFRYFTIDDLGNLLGLLDMEYDVFIDFEDRIVVAEQGFKIKNETYYVSQNNAYLVEQNENKNVGTISSFTYQVSEYGNDQYKVKVIPNGTIGDLPQQGYIKYKLTTTKYWETSANAEMIVKPLLEYQFSYTDANKNTVTRSIKVEVSSEGEATAVEV